MAHRRARRQFAQHCLERACRATRSCSGTRCHHLARATATSPGTCPRQPPRQVGIGTVSGSTTGMRRARPRASRKFLTRSTCVMMRVAAATLCTVAMKAFRDHADTASDDRQVTGAGARSSRSSMSDG
jgi:hypothetical protein